MLTSANHRRFMPPPVVSLRTPDLGTGPDEAPALAERDEDWEEFLAIALPADPVDHAAGTAWRRAPVMLSY